MQSIEIYTSQNVAIEYELASLRDRIFAFIIDSGILWFTLIIFFAVSNIAFGSTVISYIYYLMLAPIFFFYTLTMETFNNGQTIGKQALNIKVVKLNGNELNVSDFLIRWVFRMVDIYLTAGSIATMIISATDKNQRLGDILAGTTIIKNKPNQTLEINNILELYAVKDYKVNYPSVVQLSEQDMLLVKESIDRYKKYSNEAHKDAFDELVLKLKQQLGLQKLPSDNLVFLKKVLQDYIYLTR